MISLQTLRMPVAPQSKASTLTSPRFGLEFQIPKDVDGFNTLNYKPEEERQEAVPKAKAFWDCVEDALKRALPRHPVYRSLASLPAVKDLQVQFFSNASMSELGKRECKPLEFFTRGPLHDWGGKAFEFDYGLRQIEPVLNQLVDRLVEKRITMDIDQDYQGSYRQSYPPFPLNYDPLPKVNYKQSTRGLARFTEIDHGSLHWKNSIEYGQKLLTEDSRLQFLLSLPELAGTRIKLMPDGQIGISDSPTNKIFDSKRGYDNSLMVPVDTFRYKIKFPNFKSPVISPKFAFHSLWRPRFRNPYVTCLNETEMLEHLHRDFLDHLETLDPEKTNEIKVKRQLKQN